MLEVLSVEKGVGLIAFLLTACWGNHIIYIAEGLFSWFSLFAADAFFPPQNRRLEPDYFAFLVD